jgi:hypothetical protein
LSSVSFSMMFFTKGYPSGTSPETEKEPPLSHVTEVRGEGMKSISSYPRLSLEVRNNRLRNC